MFYILDFDAETDILLISNTKIEINFNKDDIKTHDDMELLLKYGRYISDEYIVKSIQEKGFKLVIEDFNEFLKYE